MMFQCAGFPGDNMRSRSMPDIFSFSPKLDQIKTRHGFTKLTRNFLKSDIKRPDISSIKDKTLFVATSGNANANSVQLGDVVYTVTANDVDSTSLTFSMTSFPASPPLFEIDAGN